MDDHPSRKGSITQKPSGPLQGPSKSTSYNISRSTTSTSDTNRITKSNRQLYNESFQQAIDKDVQTMKSFKELQAIRSQQAPRAVIERAYKLNYKRVATKFRVLNHLKGEPPDVSVRKTRVIPKLLSDCVHVNGLTGSERRESMDSAETDSSVGTYDEKKVKYSIYSQYSRDASKSIQQTFPIYIPGIPDEFTTCADMQSDLRKQANSKLPVIQDVIVYGVIEYLVPIGSNAVVVVFEGLQPARRLMRCQASGLGFRPLLCNWFFPRMNSYSEQEDYAREHKSPIVVLHLSPEDVAFIKWRKLQKYIDTQCKAVDPFFSYEREEFIP